MCVFSSLKSYYQKPFFSNPKTLLGLYIFIGFVAWFMKYFRDAYNNYEIFKGVFWHTWNVTPLYITYPTEYFDTNHYGPFFSLVIAPFAILPDSIGLLLWLVLSALLLYIAIKKLPNSRNVFILWFVAHELLTALFMQQFNVAIAAMILLTFIFIKEKKEIWAALMIMMGTFVKLYGIVGLAFFFFSKNKIKFIIALVIWAIVLFVLPMLISSPDFIFNQYQAWYISLNEKNESNLLSLMQNISLLGMVRKISIIKTYSDLWLIIPGLLLFALPYLRISQYKFLNFQKFILSSVLMFTVLFSTGSESSSYIIALTGVAIWYTSAPWQRNNWDLGLLIFAFIITSMSPSDLFPKSIRVNYILPYALKALPISIIWFKLSYELLTKDFDNEKTQSV